MGSNQTQNRETNRSVRTAENSGRGGVSALGPGVQPQAGCPAPGRRSPGNSAAWRGRTSAVCGYERWLRFGGIWIKHGAIGRSAAPGGPSAGCGTRTSGQQDPPPPAPQPEHLPAPAPRWTLPPRRLQSRRGAEGYGEGNDIALGRSPAARHSTAPQDGSARIGTGGGQRLPAWAPLPPPGVLCSPPFGAAPWYGRREGAGARGGARHCACGSRGARRAGPGWGRRSAPSAPSAPGAASVRHRPAR